MLRSRWREVHKSLTLILHLCTLTTSNVREIRWFWKRKKKKWIASAPLYTRTVCLCFVIENPLGFHDQSKFLCLLTLKKYLILSFLCNYRQIRWFCYIHTMSITHRYPPSAGNWVKLLPQHELEKLQKSTWLVPAQLAEPCSNGLPHALLLSLPVGKFKNAQDESVDFLL